MKFKTIASVIMTAALSAALFAGCGSSSGEENSNVAASDGSVQVEIVSNTDEADSAEETDKGEAVNVAMLKGPTGIGAVMLMKAQDEGTAEGNYSFSIEPAAEDVISKIVSGEVDIAAVPSNVSSALYNKTSGEIQLLDLNTFGTLYLLENGDTINSVADLAGRTINSTGQGAVPEYVLNYILQESQTENVTVEYMQTHQELATALAAGETDNGILPEPYVEIALAKNPDLRIALDIAQCYDDYTGLDKGDMPNALPMGAVIARKDFVENNPERVKLFLEEYKKSIEEVTADPSVSAEYVVKYGIVENQAVAESAIPKCSIYYVDGEKMKEVMDSFLEIMNNFNPQSIGGSIPADDFYYSE